jgi:hypothetical protein
MFAGALLPAALVATTKQLYCTPFVMALTTTGDPAAVPVRVVCPAAAQVAL